MATRDELSEVTFQAFLDWLPGAAPAGDVRAVMKQYREGLLARGSSADEASRQVNVVLGAMNAHNAVWPLLFDKIYASDAPTFRTAPNGLLRAAVAQRQPGDALEVCMGEGRNAVYLATKGWRVTGFDVSAVGLARAKARAEASGTQLTTLLQDSEAFDYGKSRWDLIVLIYAPIPVTDTNYVARLRRALKPGGLVVVESFALDPSAAVKRPVDLEPKALREAFSAFHIARFEDAYDVPDWSQEQERLVRLVAEKPST